MKRLLLTLLCPALLISISMASAAHAKLNVVATVPDLASLAKEVGGHHVSVSSLALPTQDPHFVDAKPSLALRLNQADLLLAVGLQLEVGWLPVLQRGARNPKIQSGGQGHLECSSFARLLDVRTGKIDRSEGDIHSGGNPHYLFDPHQALACAEGIAKRLTAIDPGNAADYRANFASFEKRLNAKISTWEEQMKSYRGSPVITYHRSLIYLSKWLGFEEIETLEPKPGLAPTPSHVVRVIKLAKQTRTRVLLQESYYPAKTGKLIAQKIGGRFVSLAGGANVNEGQGYIERMDALIAALQEAFGA